MEPGSWARDWPRCQLLLELASQYTLTGRTQGSHKLLSRLEEWRDRMGAGAPDLALSFVNELCYATWLLTREERGEARHHVVQAARKARQIEALLQGYQRSEIRQKGAHLRQRSAELHTKAPASCSAARSSSPVARLARPHPPPDLAAGKPPRGVAPPFLNRC